jgi:3-hydroxyacyl-CoA dehydrogenase
MSEKPNKIAEVIEASTVQFAAQCYELYELPPLGSLVRTGDIYGIVGYAETAGLEPGRKAIARGRNEITEEAVYKSSPQLARLLRSEFTAAAAGYKNGDKIYQYLPPQPARIHSFVFLCQPDEVKEFSQSFGFLNILANAALPTPTEELIAAALRQMSKAQEDSRAFLVAAGKELANLLSSDFIRLKNILGRLK